MNYSQAARSIFRSDINFAKLNNTRLRMIMTCIGHPIPPGISIFRETVVAFLNAMREGFSSGHGGALSFRGEPPFSLPSRASAI